MMTFLQFYFMYGSSKSYVINSRHHLLTPFPFLTSDMFYFSTLLVPIRLFPNSSLSSINRKMRSTILIFHGLLAALVGSGLSFHIGHKVAQLPDYSIRTTTSAQLNSHKTSCPRLEDVCETTGVTLTRFMIEVERVNPELQELAQLFSGIQTAAKAISNLVKRSQLPTSSTLGYQGEVNVQGEDQKVRHWHFFQ